MDQKLRTPPQESVVVYVHMDSLDLIISTMVSLPSVKVVVYSLCENLNELVGFEMLKFLFSSSRIEVICNDFVDSIKTTQRYDPNTVDAIIINGYHYNQQSTREDNTGLEMKVLDVIRVGCKVSKPLGFLSVLGCDRSDVGMVVSDSKFNATQGWKHAESYGLIKSSLTSYLNHNICKCVCVNATLPPFYCPYIYFYIFEV
jgi:hypothetical protein